MNEFVIEVQETAYGPQIVLQPMLLTPDQALAFAEQLAETVREFTLPFGVSRLRKSGGGAPSMM